MLFHNVKVTSEKISNITYNKNVILAIKILLSEKNKWAQNYGQLSDENKKSKQCILINKKMVKS